MQGGRTDWLVEKAAELGAARVVPLITERSTVAREKNKYGKSTPKGAHAEGVSAQADARLGRLAVAAGKQSLRVHALQVAPPAVLEEVVAGAAAAPLGLVATAGAEPVQACLAGLPASKWASM